MNELPDLKKQVDVIQSELVSIKAATLQPTLVTEEKTLYEIQDRINRSKNIFI